MNKNILRYAIFIFAFLLSSANSAFAQVAVNIDEFVQKQLESQKVAGASIAVLRDGKILTAKGYGFENLENKTPASAETVYEIASLTKQFTAAGIMLLAEEGKIKIDAPVSVYLENLPEKWRAVTVRQLLTHTSGIKNYTAAAGFNPVQDYKRDEILNLVAADALDFEPGANWNYSNTNYFLLGLMIEKVSGDSYARFLQRNIFATLGMTNTRFNDPAETIAHRAAGYSFAGGELKRAALNNPNQSFSAGALLSTVTDLAKWDAALMNETLLKKASLDESWTPAKLSTGKTATYGFGWGVSRYRGLDFVGHSGAISGFSSNITRFTADKLTVIVLTNSSGRAAEKIALEAAALYLPQLAQNAPAQKMEDGDPATSKFLREAIDKFAAGNADPAWFTPEAQKAYFPDRAQQMQTILSRQGELKTFEFINEEPRGANKLRNYRLGYANSAIRFGFVLTTEGKILGVVLRPE